MQIVEMAITKNHRKKNYLNETLPKIHDFIRIYQKRTKV